MTHLRPAVLLPNVGPQVPGELGGQSRLAGEPAERRGALRKEVQEGAITGLSGSRDCFVSRPRAGSFTAPSGFSHSSSVSHVISVGEKRKPGVSHDNSFHIHYRNV